MCPVTHALNDGLVGLLIPAVTEGWILSSQLVQGFAQLVRILLGGWLAADLDTTGSLHIGSISQSSCLGCITIPGGFIMIYLSQFSLVRTFQH